MERTKRFIVVPESLVAKKGVRGRGIVCLPTLLLFITLLFLLSCSSEKPVDVSRQEQGTVEGTIPAASRPPGVSERPSYSFEIAPQNAHRDSLIYVVPFGFSISDAKLEWFVDDRPITSSLHGKLKSTEIKKGDKVQAKALVQGRELLSNIIEISNAPPEINKVKIMPEVFRPGEALYVDVSGSDIDGENVTISYAWTKNGEPAGNTKTIEGPVKRGDRVSIKMTPYDGEAYGRSVVLHREIRNMPPVIIDDRDYSFDGKMYTFKVKASDPDGDPLTYALKSAPSGMTINPATGLIRWQVPLDFIGRADFSVSVTDGNGGEAMHDYKFNVTIGSEKKK